MKNILSIIFGAIVMLSISACGKKQGALDKAASERNAELQSVLEQINPSAK